MNPRASQLADDQFYAAHPELVDAKTAKREPLSMAPKDAKLRGEWMTSYKAADAAQKGGFGTCAVGGVLIKCPVAAALGATAAPVVAPVLPPSVPAGKPAPPPSCTVEIRANQLSSLGYFHMFIVFTDAAGKQSFLRGGPSGPGPAGLGGLSAEISGGSSNAASVDTSKSAGGALDSSGSASGSSGSSHASGSNPSASSDSSADDDSGPFGYIVTKSGDYLPGTIDWDPKAKAITLESGPATCAKHAELLKQLAAVSASKTRYNPLGPNSNSTVFTVLGNAGIKPSAPADVWAPGAEMPISTH